MSPSSECGGGLCDLLVSVVEGCHTVKWVCRVSVVEGLSECGRGVWWRVVPLSSECGGGLGLGLGFRVRVRVK